MARGAHARLGAAAIALALALGACTQDSGPPATAREDGGIAAGDAGDEGHRMLAPAASVPDDDDAGPDEGGVCAGDGACDDGQVCNGRERCVQGTCTPGAPLVCPPEHACREAAGGCDCSVPDADGDDVPAQVCSPPGERGDCDDGDLEIFPGNVEVCDPADVDEDCDPRSFGRRDDDGDGQDSDRCCNLGADGKPHCGEDCDDSAANVNRNAPESCDGVNNDCDEHIDELPGGKDDGALRGTFFRDADGDSQGDPKQVERACVQPAGYASEPGDCQDTLPQVFTGATELCNGEDDDCDGIADEDVLLPALPRTELECRGRDGVVITRCEHDGAGRLLYDDCSGGVQDGCETKMTTLRDCGACGRSCHFSCGSTQCDEVASLAAGDENTCAISAEGAVACWGANGSGQIGDDMTPAAPIARRATVIAGVRGLSVGTLHACAIAGSSGALYCWGSNAAGQLGVFNGPASSPVPLPVHGASSAFLTGVDAVAAGSTHSCAVAGGEALCWGEGLHGKLGDQDANEHPVPTPLPVFRSATRSPLRDARAIAVGALHSCALTAGGTVECWGDNRAGQLGRGDGSGLVNASMSAPVLGLSDVTAVDAGPYHSCALRAGQVYCWGSNQYGQLGGPQQHPSGAERLTDANASAVPGLSGIVQISAGLETTCARDGQGALFCWGGSRYGEIGTVDDQVHAPTRIALDAASDVAAGGGHVCARLATGPVYCWGRNASGQLGDGEVSSAPQPLPRKLHWLYGSEP